MPDGMFLQHLRPELLRGNWAMSLLTSTAAKEVAESRLLHMANIYMF
jgi:hypothetical protein